MANFSSVLRAEISRLAKQDSRLELDRLTKRLNSAVRTITELERRVAALERRERDESHQSRRSRGPGQTGPASLRFRASGLASHRQRLGLSAVDMGRLLGVSGQTIHNWEKGKSRPKVDQLERIAAMRKMGRREVDRLVSADK